MEQSGNYQVIVSERAARMLVSHAAFLAQVSPEAAEHLTAEFQTAAHSLETMPQRCPWLIGEYIPRNTYRFLLFEKRYMLIFQICGLCGGLQTGLRLAHTLIQCTPGPEQDSFRTVLLRAFFLCRNRKGGSKWQQNYNMFPSWPGRPPAR